MGYLHHERDPDRTPFSQLPEKQRRVVEFIRAELRSGNGFPKLKKIGEHMGWKQEASVCDCLLRLRCRGWVRRPRAGVYELIDGDAK